MWRGLLSVVLVTLSPLGAAVAQPMVAPDAAAIRSAAFLPPTPGQARAGGAEQQFGFGRKRAFFLYAGADPAAQLAQEDPRWRGNHESGSANALVNTRIGVGWERDNVRASFGYLRRQLPNPGGALGDKPRRDSMVGLTVSFHPGS